MALVNRFKYSLIPNSYSMGKKIFAPGFTIVIESDNPEIAFYDARPQIFKKTVLPRIEKDISSKETKTSENEYGQNSFDESELMNINLSEIEGFDEKSLKVLTDNGIITIGQVYSDGIESENLLDLTQYKGIADASETKALNVIDAFISANLKKVSE